MSIWYAALSSLNSVSALDPLLTSGCKTLDSRQYAFLASSSLAPCLILSVSYADFITHSPEKRLDLLPKLCELDYSCRSRASIRDYIRHRLFRQLHHRLWRRLPWRTF